MRQNLKQRKSEGFTIIEVMIVLAIAGLIMLIVFLAVPALQRNAHNTSIKNDVAGLLAGLQEYTDNNDGKVPLATSNPTTTGIDIGATTENVAHVKLGYIDGLTIGNVTKLTGTASAPTTAGQVKLYTNAVCSATAGQATSTGASSRNLAAVYTLDGGAKVCQAS